MSSSTFLPGSAPPPLGNPQDGYNSRHERAAHSGNDPHVGAGDTANGTPDNLPEMMPRERREAQRRVTISALVVHEAVREEGERELERHPAALAWSGLAAGLSMGFSMVGQGLLQAYLPSAPWRPLVSSLGYTFGFLIVVLGRQQLFTESTLTAVLPLLAHLSKETVMRVARLWGIVLTTNLLGALIFSALVAHMPVFSAEVNKAFAAIGMEALRDGFWPTFLRAIFAGWLIALMVWLLPAADATRLHVVVAITYLIALGAFAHIIASSIEVMYLAHMGIISWLTYLTRFLAPTVLGNIFGGVTLVALLNYAQVASETLVSAKD